MKASSIIQQVKINDQHADPDIVDMIHASRIGEVGLRSIGQGSVTISMGTSSCSLVKDGQS